MFGGLWGFLFFTFQLNIINFRKIFIISIIFLSMEIKKLVVLDKNDFNEKQIKELEGLAEEVVIYKEMPKNDDEAFQRIRDADAVLVGWSALTKRHIASCPKLKYLGVIASGYSWLAAEYASRKGITVTNVPGYATKAVTSFIFNQLKKFGIKEKAKKIIGIIGLGRIGESVAKTAKEKGFGVVYWNRTPKETEFEAVSFENVFKKSDAVNLLVKGSEETKGIVKNEHLDMLKDGAILVNVVSPTLIEDEDYLLEMTEKRGINLILDFEEKSRLEEIAKDVKNILYTNGIAWKSPESILNLHQIALENLKAYKEGKPQNTINQNS